MRTFYRIAWAIVERLGCLIGQHDWSYSRGEIRSCLVCGKVQQKAIRVTWERR
jgi:hypothetical protein